MSLKIRENVKNDLVPKKDGNVQICVDYQYLNKASPKNDLPFPFIDVIVNNTIRNIIFSFTDYFYGYI